MMTNKAVFLDRDGVINRELGEYVDSPDRFEILPHVFENLRQLQDAGFLLIVITNQGGIAKGKYTVEQLNTMHNYLQQAAAGHHVKIDAIYYCPHHPDFGKCLCRKPGSLLIEKALAKFEINPSKSWMIGDKERDMQAAAGAGVNGLLVAANVNWHTQVDLIVNSLNA